jgi:hypothetical protein
VSSYFIEAYDCYYDEPLYPFRLTSLAEAAVLVADLYSAQTQINSERFRFRYTIMSNHAFGTLVPTADYVNEDHEIWLDRIKEK